MITMDYKTKLQREHDENETYVKYNNEAKVTRNTMKTKLMWNTITAWHSMSGSGVTSAQGNPFEFDSGGCLG